MFIAPATISHSLVSKAPLQGSPQHLLDLGQLQTQWKNLALSLSCLSLPHALVQTYSLRSWVDYSGNYNLV